ncbi:MAG TPA: CDP-archaeol synthase [Gemmatimonadaceae bacterium]|nr:CDP-archaeol synthase [Gemmatimonadaceae bacterium]
MTDTTLHSYAVAVFIVAAFVIAGLVHSAWLASPLSRRLQMPIDGRVHFRGRRLFGDNKTVRGFIVMPPAAGFAFWALGTLLGEIAPPLRDNLWPLSNGGLALLGTWAGLGFMLGELPNSFVKRQFDIPPGRPANGELSSLLSFAVDRVDSIFGVLIALSIVVPTSWMTWVFAILIGPFVHFCFSVLLFRLGVKARRA